MPLFFGQMLLCLRVTFEIVAAICDYDGLRIKLICWDEKGKMVKVWVFNDVAGSLDRSEERLGWEKRQGELGVALPICNFPHGGSYRMSSGWCNRGLGSHPGGPRELLQVSSVEGPGFHQPVRKENHRGEAVSTDKRNLRASSCQERRWVAHSSEMLKKYLNLVLSSVRSKLRHPCFT